VSVFVDGKLAVCERDKPGSDDWRVQFKGTMA